MRFLFDTYKQHHDEGMAAHRAGDYAKARVHYLMAAKYLCARDKEGEGEFKEEGLKKAQRLIEIAKELEGMRGETQNLASLQGGGGRRRKGGDGWDSVRRSGGGPAGRGAGGGGGES